MKIVIAIDLSEESRYATRWALDLRDRLRESDKPVETIALSVAPSSWYSTDREQKVTHDPGIYHNLTHQIRDFLESVDPDVDDVEIAIDEGRPTDIITEYCHTRNVDWLVVGMSDLGPVGRFMWGSTVHSLADRVRSRMAIIHPEHDRLMSSMNFVLGIDFLPDSHHALLTAAELADSADAHLHLVHALQDPPTTTLSTGLVNYLSPGDIAHRTATARHSLENLMAQVQLKYPDLNYITLVHSGPPEKILAQYIDEIDADMVLLGKGHRSAVEKWILGSVSRGLLKRMPTTLILVPPDDR